MWGKGTKRFAVEVAAVGALIALGVVWAPGAGATVPGRDGLIAYEGVNGRGVPSIWVRSPSGRAQTIAANAINPAFSRSGNLIAFVDTSGAGQDLAVMHPDGSHREIVLRTPNEKEWDPVWAPGNRLIYARGPFPKPDPNANRPPPTLRSLHFRGRVDRPLGITGWSPDVAVDGELVYAGTSLICPEHQALFTRLGPDFAGEKSTEFAPGRCVPRFDPSWHPTDYLLAYGSYPPYPSESVLYMGYTAPPIEEFRLTRTDGLRHEQPAWSPSGNQIAFSVREGRTRKGVYIWRESDGRITLIGNSARWQGANPTWQPR